MIKRSKDLFQDKVLSDAFRSVMETKLLSHAEAAEILQINVTSLNNKLSRNSFSLHDFIVMCSVCDCQFAINNDTTKLKIEFSPEIFLSETEQEHINETKIQLQNRIQKQLDRMPE